MISSEVQRTLVKSPPELWAEISDPEALARHLSDLGEIKITRTEPEKLVEWDAGTTTGTVEIKPSGWGTKVTLSVSRETPAPESPPDATGLQAPVEDAHADPEAEKVVESDAEAQVPEPTAVEVDPTATDTAQPATRSEPIHEPVTASERFAPDFPPPLRGERRQAPAPVEDTVPLPPPLPLRDSEPLPAPVPEPQRPGFFARLFGRGRNRPEETVQLASEPQAPEPDPIEAPAPDPIEAPAPAADWPTISTDFPALVQRDATALVPEGTAEPEPEPATLPQMSNTVEGEHGAEIHPGPEPSAGVQAETDELVEAASTAPDLATELREAEEASEEMTAVLSAVLDRLGAAHHRPFSRS
jgi:hypothetical protein